MCVPVAAKDLGCTVTCRSDGARSPRPSQVCERECCWGGAATCHRAGGLPVRRHAGGVTGGLIREVVLRRAGVCLAEERGGCREVVVRCLVGTPVCAEPGALRAVLRGMSFPAAVTRRAWQQSQPRHSALSVQFHTIASFFLTCLL